MKKKRNKFIYLFGLKSFSILGDVINKVIL